MKTSVSPSILPAISSDGGGSVERADQAEGHQEGEQAPQGGAAAAQADGEIESESVLRRALPSPYMPSISEIRLHKTTHLPYRSWCVECVEAFAREWPHLARDGPSDRVIPVIHIDYACLTEKGLFKPADLNEEELKHAVRVIVEYCSGSSSPFHLCMSCPARRRPGASSPRSELWRISCSLATPVSFCEVTTSQRCSCSSAMR